jgi:5-methylcytosine-specific restriction endonuclease McrA
VMILRRSPMKRGRVKKVRSKPRAGRLKGADMEQLRRECFERDFYLCQGFVCDLVVDWMQFGHTCNRPVTWETGHMAHIGAKRRHGDSLDNVRTLCAECHQIEHAYGKSGVKPCPPKGNNDVQGHV